MLFQSHIVHCIVLHVECNTCYSHGNTIDLIRILKNKIIRWCFLPCDTFFILSVLVCQNSWYPQSISRMRNPLKMALLQTEKCVPLALQRYICNFHIHIYLHIQTLYLFALVKYKKFPICFVILNFITIFHICQGMSKYFSGVLDNYQKIHQVHMRLHVHF